MIMTVMVAVTLLKISIKTMMTSLMSMMIAQPVTKVGFQPV